MEIIVNGQIQHFENSGNLSVKYLLDSFIGENQNGIAVAINNQVIPKSLWAETSLKEKEEVLIIKATQGG